MTTVYPGTLDSFSVKVDGVTDVLAAHVNDLQDSVVAIETALGASLVNIAAADTNIFINGEFDVWQRSTDNTAVSTLPVYVADRWWIKTSAGTLAHVQRSTTVRTGAASRYSMQLDGVAGAGTVQIAQRIATEEIGRYKRTLAFSCYLYNGTGGAFTPKLYASTATITDDWTASNVRNGGGSGENLQSCADAAWTRLTWSADVSGYTDIAKGLEIKIEVPSGVLLASDVVRLAEMNLTPGAVFPAFIPRPQGQTLALCQRYLYVLDASSNTANQGQGAKLSTTNAQLTFQHPVSMRNVPSVSHNITGYTGGNPGTTTIALVNYATNNFFTITGALTVTKANGNTLYTALDFTAGTRWSDTAGNLATLRIGPGVVLQISSEI